MGTPRNDESFDQYRSFQARLSRRFGMIIGSWILLAILIASFTGCSNSTKGTNSNSAGGAAGNSNGNANAPAASTPLATIDFKEPERYSLAMTISAQAVAEAPSPMATQQFGFAKLGSDRKWSFALPAPLGHVVYLEKSGLKYLVFVDRSQYVEVSSDALAFPPSSVLTPIAIAEKLNPRAQYEQLGLEPVNGRTAVKYRITSDAAGARKTDGVIFVDQETGLPLRYELTTPETNQRVIVEARDVRLSPDPLQFEVPAGMRKITPQEARSLIEAFAGSLRSFSDIMSGKLLPLMRFN